MTPVFVGAPVDEQAEEGAEPDYAGDYGEDLEEGGHGGVSFGGVEWREGGVEGERGKEEGGGGKDGRMEK